MKMNNASKNIIEEMFYHYYNADMNQYYDYNNNNDSSNQYLNILNKNLVSPAEIVNIKLASNSPEQFITNLFILLQSK